MTGLIQFIILPDAQHCDSQIPTFNATSFFAFLLLVCLGTSPQLMLTRRTILKVEYNVEYQIPL